MKKYLLPLFIFSLSLVSFLISLPGADNPDKLNFLKDPYFWFWGLSIILFSLGSLMSLYFIIRDLIQHFLTKE